MLINVKMPAPSSVGILTFIVMISITSELYEQEKNVILQDFSFYEQLKFQTA